MHDVNQPAAAGDARAGPRDATDPAGKPHTVVSRLPGHGHATGESIKATLIAMVIAFVLVLAFRAFVLEAFVIPTGSMAPTLLGRHARFQSEASGFSWAVNSWAERGWAGGGRRLQAADPQSAEPVDAPTVDSRPGDRILVLKSLYAVLAPKRWDVVVFKNPQKPDENYIKRLVGLPGERVWLVAGDVFTSAPGDERWRIARVPDDVQRSLWWPLFSSERTPIDAEGWEGPWMVERAGSSEHVRTRAVSVSPRAGVETLLRWDDQRFPITDVAPYNLGPMIRSPETDAAAFSELFRRQLSGGYPAGDVRLTATIEGTRAADAVAATIAADGHEFRAEVRGAEAALLMRKAGDAGWAVLTRCAVTPLSLAGRGAPTPIEFWRHDQTLSLWIAGRRVLRAEYGWDGFERLAFATGRTTDEARALERSADVRAVLDPSRYAPTRAWWSFTRERSGTAAESADATSEGAITVRRFGLWRGLFYRPAFAEDAVGQPARGTHPARPVTLGPDEFFMLGDNSASSKDGRLWENVHPWVASQFSPTAGVVHRDMLLGRAFFVYFPAPRDVEIGGRLKSVVPDFGRMRWIR